MSAMAVITIILGLALAFYGDSHFYAFLSGFSFGVGLVFGLVAIVNYRAVRKRERWWKGK